MGRSNQRGTKKKKTNSRSRRATTNITYQGDHNEIRDNTAGGSIAGTQSLLGETRREGTAQARAALPPVEWGFTGRDEDSAQLMDALDPAAVQAAPVVVLAGMGGIGKTQLALAAAHTAVKEKEWFPRAVFIDLHGYTTPVDAHRALQSLLTALGAEAEQIPEDTQARETFYRAHLDRHEGPVLVVADNASHLDQLTPLDPGEGGHRMLVTSRERLGELSARRLNLDVLDDTRAQQVLAKDLALSDPGDERITDTIGLQALATACAGMPLALRIGGAQLKDSPDLTPGELAAKLTREAGRLFKLEDRIRSLHAVFESSHRRLPREQAELLALLGLAPGPDISTEASAVLANTDEHQVLAGLRGLAAAHLVRPSGAGERQRWGMHDLVGEYAATLAAGKNAPSRYPRALRRLLDHYTARATDADRHLRALPTDQYPPPATFSGREDALAWLDADRAALLGAVHTAHTTNHRRASIGLALNLGKYLDLRRLFQDHIAVATIARDTAREISDRHSEAHAWNNLGTALHEVRRFEKAIDAHTHARDQFHQLGDHHSEAHAWNNLGTALSGVRRFEKAIDAHTHARDQFHQLGDRHSEAHAWNNLGGVLREVQRFEKAIDAHTHARDQFHQLGDRHSEAGTWNNLGGVLREVQRFEKAIDAHTHARDTYASLDDHHSKENARAGIGIALSGVERWSEAETHLQQALAFFHQERDRYSEGRVRYELGLVHQNSGCPTDAITELAKAVALFEATNDPHYREKAATSLAECRQAIGHN